MLGGSGLLVTPWLPRQRPPRGTLTGGLSAGIMRVTAEQRTHQNLAIALALFEGKTDAEAAVAAEVGERTVSTRKQSDEVQTELQRLRFEQAEAMVEAVGDTAFQKAAAAAQVALANLDVVLEGMLAIAQDTANTASVRRQAYKDYADQIFKILGRQSTGGDDDDAGWETVRDGGKIRVRPVKGLNDA